jgi:hypothetical protein
LFLVLTLIGVVPAQNDVVADDRLATDSLDLTDVIVDVQASAEPVAVDKSTSEDVVVRVVRLKSDGLLEGRVSIIQPTGKRLPANAAVQFARDGVLVNQVKTNETGQFEVAGMKPGAYTATASIEAGSTDFAVNVLPFDKNARPDQMILDATLTPTPELYVGADNTCVGCGAIVEGGYVEGGIEGGQLMCADCLAQEVIVSEEIIAEVPCSMGTACATSCGFSGGGGCCGGGGGRGLGWLLGAGGLAAGITALALRDNDDDEPASPANP